MIQEIKKMLSNICNNKKCCINIFLAVITYTAIILYYNLNKDFSIFFVLVFIALLIFYFKGQVDISQKVKKIAIVMGVILTLLVVTGGIVNKYSLEATMIFTLKNSLFWVVEVIGFIPFFYLLFKNIYYYSDKVKVTTSEKRNNGLKFFVLALLIIFGSYLVYFWRYFPAKMTPDSYSQIYQIQSGDFSDHHPYAHTKFVGLFFNLGTFLFHSDNWGIGLYTLVQMLIMASLYAYVCYYLYKQKVDLKICFLVLLAYAFLPQYTHYSVTLWKDILFAGSFILIFISLLEFAKNNFQIKQIILFTIGLIMMLFFRNNGIYIFVFMIPFLLWRFKHKIKLFASLLSILLISFFVIKGPVYQSLGVSKTSIKESLSIPLQQMARVVVLDKNIDKESQKYLNELMNIKKLKKEYLPYISDPAKNVSNQKVINADKIKFIKVWVNLFFQNPQVYIEAYLAQTLGYWFPSVDYLVTTYPPKISNMPNIFAKVIDFTTVKSVPFASIFYGIGLNFIITLICFTISLLRKNRNLIAYVPFLGLWLTMMIASPVYAEMRYVYGLFVCIPLIIFIPFMSKEFNNKN